MSNKLYFEHALSQVTVAMVTINHAPRLWPHLGNMHGQHRAPLLPLITSHLLSCSARPFPSRHFISISPRTSIKRQPNPPPPPTTELASETTWRLLGRRVREDVGEDRASRRWVRNLRRAGGVRWWWRQYSRGELSRKDGERRRTDRGGTSRRTERRGGREVVTGGSVWL